MASLDAVVSIKLDVSATARATILRTASNIIEEEGELTPLMKERIRRLATRLEHEAKRR